MINTVHPHNLPQVSVKYSNSLSCLNDDTLGRLFWWFIWSWGGRWTPHTVLPLHLTLIHRSEHKVTGHIAPSERWRLGPWNQTMEAGEASLVLTFLGDLARVRWWASFYAQPQEWSGTEGSEWQFSKESISLDHPGDQPPLPQSPPTCLALRACCWTFFLPFCSVFHCYHADSCRNTWRLLGSCSTQMLGSVMYFSPLCCCFWVFLWLPGGLHSCLWEGRALWGASGVWNLRDWFCWADRMAGSLRVSLPFSHSNVSF